MKKILSFTLATILALGMTACGNSGSGEPTEKDFEKAAEKLDNMTDEDFEKAAEKAFGEDEPSSPSAEKKDTFEPCQEILDADFTSGLIQIGDDVFKCGGYLTVSDLVNQYGDRYHFDDVDLSKKLAADETEGTFEIKNKKTGYKVKVQYCKHGDLLGEAVAYNFADTTALNKITYYPTGILRFDNYVKSINISEDGSNIEFELPVHSFNTKGVFGTNGLMDNSYDEITNDLERTERFLCFDSFQKYGESNGKNNILMYKSSGGTLFYNYGAVVKLKEQNLFGTNPSVTCIMHTIANVKMEFGYGQFYLNESTVLPKNIDLFLTKETGIV